MNSVFLILALFSEAAGTISLKLSQGFSKRLAGLATVVLYGLSLSLLSFALNIKGFEVNMIYAAWSGVGIAFIAAMELLWKQGKKWNGRDIGPIGSTARMVLGFWLAAWHWWRIHRNPARFQDTSLLSFALSVALPLALYFTWWYAPAFSVTSDAVLLFVGGSMVLAALRGYAGCELLALSNWLLRRSDQIACAVFTPIDSVELRGLASA